MEYKEISGDLVKLGLEGKFDAIAHGCNCFCIMGAGLAPQMAKAFGVDKYELERHHYKGEINKLGNIEYEYITVENGVEMAAINCYSQYGLGINHKEGSVAPLNYAALEMCLTKINHTFKGKHVGLPQIGCHLAGGDWDTVKAMIQNLMTDCDVTVVIYDKK